MPYNPNSQMSLGPITIEGGDGPPRFALDMWTKHINRYFLTLLTQSILTLVLLAHHIHHMRSQMVMRGGESVIQCERVRYDIGREKSKV